MSEQRVIAAVDVGTECIKAIVMAEDTSILGRSIIPASGYFHHRVNQALEGALDEAGLQLHDLNAVSATGFGASCVDGATARMGETACHARGAYFHFPHAMSVIDMGGRDPKLLQVNDSGQVEEARIARRCAVGIGTFLMFTARHLDVHPTRLQELAAGSDEPADIGSYCSVFAGSEVLEHLREGTRREDIASGCVRSVAERIFEIGGLQEPVRVTGGVAEYFPGVLQSLSEMTGIRIEAVPEPIMAGAIGAALKILRSGAIAHEIYGEE